MSFFMCILFITEANDLYIFEQYPNYKKHEKISYAPKHFLRNLSANTFDSAPQMRKAHGNCIMVCQDNNGSTLAISLNIHVK